EGPRLPADLRHAEILARGRDRDHRRSRSVPLAAVLLAVVLPLALLARLRDWMLRGRAAAQCEKSGGDECNQLDHQSLSHEVPPGFHDDSRYYAVRARRDCERREATMWSR